MSVNTKVNGELVKSAGLYRVATPIGMADIYSTEEKEVGLWINNKPLYKKSFVFDTVVTATSNAWVDTGVDIANAVAIDAEAVLYQSDGNSIVIECNIGVDGSIYVLNPRSVNMDINALTIRYTKTTDTPWSGKFVPQGYGYVSSGDIYSLEERQVGVWTNGKPLYQKTIDCGTLPNNSTKNIETLTNIEYVVDIEGFVYDNSGYFRPLPFTADSTNIIRVDVQDSVLRIITYTDWSGYAGSYITIKYTKTTDVPGSGEYVPSGDKAVHYSTEEEVIGTFLGETLYRKVIPITANWDFTANVWVKSNIPIGDIKAFINGRIEIFYNNTYSLHFVQLGVIDNMIAGNSFRQFSAVANGANLILEYTKTS